MRRGYSLLSREQSHLVSYSVNGWGRQADTAPIWSIRKWEIVAAPEGCDAGVAVPGKMLVGEGVLQSWAM